MRLLTVRQPWAEAIAAAATNPAAKLVENRGRGFPKSYRGVLGIHAGQAASVRGAMSPLVNEVVADRYSTLPRGAVIALAELVDVHPSAGCCRPWGEDTYPMVDGKPATQVTHLVLERVRRIDPVPAKGALGLWRPDEDLALELAHRLADLVTWDLAGARSVADRGDIAQLWSLVSEQVPA